MEFRILGPLQVLDGEAEVPVGSPKERALLAVLLLHAGAVVSRERLIDELWGESPPPTAAKALNVHVSQLRKTLARSGHDPVVTRPPGYALKVEPERLDAGRFERLVAAARDRVAAGDLQSASGLLREAAALWRGPALDGVGLGAAARSDAGRLEELRLTAQMDRIDCELALGLHEQLIAELDALVVQHPLRERLRGQLMLALYRCGRQADALRCYREARATLVGELGIEPSQPLQRLEKAILNQEPSLEAPTGISGADHPSSDRTGRESQLLLRRWLSSVSAIGSHRRRAAIVAMLVAIAAASAVLLLVRATAPASVLLAPNSLGRIDPGMNKLVAVTRFGPGPRHLITGANRIWVLKRQYRVLLGVNAKTHAIVDSFGLDDYPTALAAVSPDVWVVTTRLTLLRIESDNGTVLQRLPLNRNRELTQAELNQPPSLAVGDHSLWVSSQRTVWRINPKTSGVLARIPVREHVTAIGFGEGAVWVVGFTDAAEFLLSEISTRTNTVVANAGLHSEPGPVAAGAGGVWVAEHWDDTVWQFDPADVRVTAIIPTGDGPASIAVADGAAWVANWHDNTVARIDPTTSRRVATIKTGAGPIEIAADSSGIWVATSTRHLN
jgi:YVTN family beta-propeller protein